MGIYRSFNNQELTEVNISKGSDILPIFHINKYNFYYEFFKILFHIFAHYQQITGAVIIKVYSRSPNLYTVLL